MDPTKKAVPCSCSHACLYYMIRCDACHRGVHFSCIGMTLAAAATKMVYVCRTCQDTVHEDDLSEQLKAQRKPGAVVFTATCRQHNSVTGERRGTSTTTPTLIHRDEELSTARCDACDIRCSFDLIQCDECAAWCHYACAKMTPKLATSIDKWYCGGCRRKDSALEITYVRGLVPEKHPCNRRQGSH